jgi:hypothetical protein
MEKRTKIVCGSCQVPPEKSLVFKISWKMTFLMYEQKWILCILWRWFNRNPPGACQSRDYCVMHSHDSIGSAG